MRFQDASKPPSWTAQHKVRVYSIHLGLPQPAGPSTEEASTPGSDRSSHEGHICEIRSSAVPATKVVGPSEHGVTLRCLPSPHEAGPQPPPWKASVQGGGATPRPHRVTMVRTPAWGTSWLEALLKSQNLGAVRGSAAGALLPLGATWPCAETFGVVTAGGVPGLPCRGTRHATKIL